MEQVTTVGIDLAKNVFSLHGVDMTGKTVLRRTVRRERLAQTVAALSPCLIGMEACSGAYESGRKFQDQGHTVKLMAPKSWHRTGRAARTTATTPKRSARRGRAQACASCRSRA